MKKILLFSFLLIFLFYPTQVGADYLIPQGGAGVISQLSINKTVKNPQTGIFVENLLVSDPHFLPDQNINFRIEVRNSGNTDLTSISVKDVLPNSVDFVSGPGNFDNSSKTLNFSVDKLNPGESKTLEITGKISSSNFIATNQITCFTNLTEARVNQLVNQDTATFCIETQILAPLQELPKTGPAKTLGILGGSISLLVISLLFYRKSLS